MGVGLFVAVAVVGWGLGVLVALGASAILPLCVVFTFWDWSCLMSFFSITFTLPCLTALRRSSSDKDLRSFTSATLSPVSDPRLVSLVSSEVSSEDSSEGSDEVSSSSLEDAAKEIWSRYCCAALSSMFSEARSTSLLDIMAATQTEPIVAKKIAPASIRLILAGFSVAEQNLANLPCCFSLAAFFCKI